MISTKKILAAAVCFIMLMLIGQATVTAQNSNVFTRSDGVRFERDEEFLQFYFPHENENRRGTRLSTLEEMGHERPAIHASPFLPSTPTGQNVRAIGAVTLLQSTHLWSRDDGLVFELMEWSDGIYIQGMLPIGRGWMRPTVDAEFERGLNEMLQNAGMRPLSEQDMTAIRNALQPYSSLLTPIAATENVQQVQNIQQQPATHQHISVFLDGRRLSFDQPPVIRNDRTMVPFRAIFEAFGATVSWDSYTHTVTADHGQRIIQLQIDSYTAIINGVSTNIDAVPFIATDTGRTLVPLRFVSEALGAEVEWNATRRIVDIWSDGNNIISDTLLWADVAEDFSNWGGLPVWEEVRYLGEWMRHDSSVWNQIIDGFYFNFYGFRISEASYLEAVAARDRILAQIIRPGMSDFEKVRAVHHWLVYNVSYNSDVFDRQRFPETDGRNPNPPYRRYRFESQTAWAALILRTVVCGGYSDAFNFMLEPLGIGVYYITGYVRCGTYHAWNMVRIDGRWFHVDLTWNRRDFGSHHLVTYDLFLLSDSEIRSQGHHNWNLNHSATWPATSRPAAPSTFAWERPQLIFDHSINRWRHRTAADTTYFHVTTNVSQNEAGTTSASPQSSRPGQWVTINAHANQGFTFSHWDILSGNITFHQTSGAWASFMMPAGDVSLRAVFTQTAAAQAHTINVSVDNPAAGNANASVNTIAPGQWVTINAHANQGFTFSHWDILSGNITFHQTSGAWASFMMPAGDVSLRAVFTQNAIVQPHTINISVDNPAAGSASANVNTANPGQWVVIDAHENQGFTFSHWEILSGNVSFNQASGTWAQFMMPDGDVSIRAVLRELFSVNVSVNNPQSGTAGASGYGMLLGTGREGVSLSAQPSPGFEFSHWEVISGNVVLQNPTLSSTSFLMPASHVSIRAVFREVQTFP